MEDGFGAAQGAGAAAHQVGAGRADGAGQLGAYLVHRVRAPAPSLQRRVRRGRGGGHGGLRGGDRMAPNPCLSTAAWWFEV